MPPELKFGALGKFNSERPRAADSTPARASYVPMEAYTSGRGSVRGRERQGGRPEGEAFLSKVKLASGQALGRQ
jgi:hypothetical protein